MQPLSRLPIARWLALAACGFVLATAQAQEKRPDSPELSTPLTEKKLAHGKHFMVSAAHPLAAEAGVAMLAKGGSAIDAAIAVQMVLNLVEPQSSGLGGGAFMLYFDASAKAVTAYDGRETAPAGAKPDMFLEVNGKPPTRFAEAVIGGRSVGVPGVLRALEMAHARHGKLPWAALFQPAIELAEKGFPLSGRTQVHIVNNPVLFANPATRAYFFLPDGSPKPVGTIMKNPAFAALLKRIAKDGPDAFYTGDVARDMVAAVHSSSAHPGTLSEADLAGYRARAGEALCGNYREYRLCGMPLPSSGGIAVLQVMQMLERFPLTEMKPGSVAALHLMAEAEKLAYADRDRYAADDHFVDVPTAALLNRDYLRTRSALISPDHAMGRATAGEPLVTKIALADGEVPELPSTSHFSLVDRDGNGISMTTSVESYFGSHVFVHGFFLNNQMTDFSLIPERDGVAVANAVFPGKRPRSAMSPFVVQDKSGNLYELIGSPGGSMIINFVTKALIATLDWKLDIQAAAAFPNGGSRNGPIELEKNTAYEKLLPELKALGHEVRVFDMPSGLHGVLRSKDGWTGGADPRRDGVALGQ